MFTTIINPTQLQSLADVLLFDVRHDLMNLDAGHTAYLASHIKGAHFLHLDRDLSGIKTGQNGRHPLPDLKILVDKLRGLGMNNGTQVVVYDAANSMIAARAWWLLRHIGHENIAVLDGGFSAWRGDTEPVMTVTPAPGNLTLRPSLNTQVFANDLMTHIDDGFYSIIDARAPERFSGAIEPMDKVAGHIPHAINHFFMHNLNDDLTFKTAFELQQIWQPIFEHTKVINQCGSGVTACHNILAQHIAGYNTAALYVGSWSEWCSNHERPVA